MIPGDAEDMRDQEVAEHVPRRLGCLRAVVRIGRAGTLAPALAAFGVADAHQDMVQVIFGVARRGERSNQRQSHQEQLDRSQGVAHWLRSSRYRGRAASTRLNPETM